MKLLVKLAFMCLLLIPLACKKKSPGGRLAEEAKGDQPIANGFAIKSAIAIYDSPEQRAKAIATLPIGNSVMIFATKVPDKKTPDKAFWYRVKYAPLTAGNPASPVEGYISEREEVLRQNFLVFVKKDTEKAMSVGPDGKETEISGEPGVMATTTVNLRKSPALNGAVVRQLKNGEVLKVLAESTASVKVDDKSGQWFLVTDNAGVQGYCYGGYMLTGIHTELAGLSDLGFQFRKGWARLNADVKPLRSPQGSNLYNLEEIYLRDGSKYTSGKLAKGMLLQVDAELTRAPEKRYRAMIRTEMEPGYFQEYKFYIPVAKVNFIKDYYEISKAQPNTIDPKIADDVNRYLGGDLNLECSRIDRFETGGGTGDVRKFVAVHAAVGPAEKIEHEGRTYCTGLLAQNAVLAEEKDGKLFFMHREQSGDATLDDLDGDGVPELVSEHSHPRGGYSLQIFALRNSKFSPIFEFNDLRGGGYCVNFQFKDKRISVDYSDAYKESLTNPERAGSCDSELEGLVHTFKGLTITHGTPFKVHFEGGKLVKTDAPATPQAPAPAN